MAVEFLGLSNFKLQLLALVSEARDLRERERSAREELERSDQKQQQIEADYSKQLQELRSELTSRDEIRMKLESRVKYLEDEIELLEKKEKDRKETITGLLQSREAFIRHYEDSSCALKGSIQMKDRAIAVISEKLNAHLALFGSVEKEATAIKQVLDGVQLLVNEKEQVVIELKDKMQRISTLENEFVEKVTFLESKLNDCRLELQRRDTIIWKLKEHLEAQKLNSNFQPIIEELRKALVVKDEIIQRLTSEKQSLHLELHNMDVALRNFQDIFSYMRNEDLKGPSSVLGSQGPPQLVSMVEHDTLENTVQAAQQDSLDKITDSGSTELTATCQHGECESGNDSSGKDVLDQATLPKLPALPPPKSPSSNAATVDCLHRNKDGNTGNGIFVQLIGSGSSIPEAES